MPNPRRNVVYPTDPEDQKRLSEYVARHKYSDKHLTLPCAVCGQTTPHAVAKLIDSGELRYAIRCSNCKAVATIVADGAIRRR